MEQAPEIGGAQGAASLPQATGSSPTHAATAAGFRLTGNKHGRAAASSESIMGLQEVAPPTDGSDCCCAICLKDMDGHDKLRAMPCSHAFHQDCIFMWLHRNATCPLCRHQLPTEEADNEEEEEVRRIGIFLEKVNRLHNVLEQQLQRIRILSERLDRWLNLAEEHRQTIRSQSST